MNAIVLVVFKLTESLLGTFGILISFIGLAFIVSSKKELFDRRKFFTFGPGEMSLKFRRRYFIGYTLVGAGAGLCIWVIGVMILTG